MQHARTGKRYKERTCRTGRRRNRTIKEGKKELKRPPKLPSAIGGREGSSEGARSETMRQARKEAGRVARSGKASEEAATCTLQGGPQHGRTACLMRRKMPKDVRDTRARCVAREHPKMGQNRAGWQFLSSSSIFCWLCSFSLPRSSPGCQPATVGIVVVGDGGDSWWRPVGS